MHSGVDKIIRDIGGFGIYQWITMVLAYTSNFTAVWSYLIMTFAGQTPPVMCVNDTSNTYFVNKVHEGVPGDADLCIKAGNITCTMFSYGTNEMDTIVSEWNLVCNRKWIPSIIYTVLLIGSCVGGPIFGAIGDVFGRKPALFMSTILLIGLHIASAYSPSCVVYGILQFFVGMCANGYRISHLNGILENSPANWHAVVVGIPSRAIAACVFAIVAWAVHDWRSLHLISAGFGVPLLTFWWFFQESIRWLDANQQHEKTEKVMTFIAKANCSKPSSLEHAFKTKPKMSPGLQYRFIMSDFIANKDNVAMAACLLFVWFSVSFGFHGISLGVNSLSDNYYLNMFLLNVVDVPAALIASVLLYRFGRNCLNVAFLLACGLTCIGVGFMQSCPVHVPVNQDIVTAFGLVAKTLVGLSVILTTIYSLELVPTSARSTVYGTLLLASDVGGCICPLVIQLDLKIRGILYFLTGSLMVSSTGMMLLIRETKQTELLDVEIIIKPDTDTVQQTTEDKQHGYEAIEE